MNKEQVKSLLSRVNLACDENISKGIDLAWSNQSGVNVSWDELRKSLEFIESFLADDQDEEDVK